MTVELSSEESGEKTTPAQAKRAIHKLSWTELCKLVKISFYPGDIKYRKSMHRHLCDTRLFTLEQAREYLRMYSPSVIAGSADQRPTSMRKNKAQVICKKCFEAGVTEKVTKHKTEACVDEIRKMNLKNLERTEEVARMTLIINSSGSKKS